MPIAPTGTVTFLFTDIEGSTRLWQEQPEQMQVNLARHDALLRAAIEKNEGYVFKTVGDAFCAAFPTAIQGVKAALAAQQALRREDWGAAVIKVRIGLHTGDAEERDQDYFGLTLSRTARLMSAGHGGQILLSLATQELVRDKLEAGVALVDLGERRLKDLIRPERIFQLNAPGLETAFAPLKTLDAYCHNLPPQITSFIGREKEMIAVKKALAEHRLVTLTGPGGTGKTRLSLQVAADLLDLFPSGLWFVELAPLADPALIPQTILAATGAQAQPGKSALETVSDLLRDKTSLLVLDNCEHLVEACARLADTLLRAAPGLKILASSREALGIKGELVWRVPSLSIPELKPRPVVGSLSQYEAVRLFIDRARLVQPQFAVTDANAPAIAQICARLDGIPLAIELAAARVRILSAEQIAARLDDCFRLLTGGSRTALPRQQTLRALIDWSYDLLTENERLLFRRLAVFIGGWTLELAEQTCSDESLASCEVLDLLSRLVDKSLVNLSEGSAATRYRMLETVRQYAHEKLSAAGEAEAARDRHLQSFTALAEKAEPEIRASNQVVWLDILDDEIDNLRAALEWALERDPESGQRLASALWRFLNIRGHTADRAWLPKALAATAGSPTVRRACALARAAYLAWGHGSAQARVLAKEAEILSQELGDQTSLALALMIQGALETNRPPKTALLEQALALSRALNDHWLAGFILALQADGLVNHNDLASAAAVYQQALEEIRRAGDKRLISSGLKQLGNIALAQGEAAQAEQLFQAALGLAQEIRDIPNIWNIHSDLTLVKLLLEDFASAETMLAKAFELAQADKLYICTTHLYAAWIELAQDRVAPAIAQLELGLPLARQTAYVSATADLTYALGDALRRRQDFTAAQSRYQEALALYRGENLENGCCDCLEGFGLLAIDRQQMDRGARLLGAWKGLSAYVYSQNFFPFMVRERQARLAAARAQLGAAAFDQAWAEGQAMSMDEAIDMAAEH